MNSMRPFDTLRITAEFFFSTILRKQAVPETNPVFLIIAVHGTAIVIQVIKTRIPKPNYKSNRKSRMAENILA